VAGVSVAGVFLEQLVKVGRVEDVDAHARQRHLGVAGHGGRVGGLLDELGDVAGVVDGHHAKGVGVAAGHLDAAHGDLAAALHVVAQHHPVVHLVHMVAGQDQDVLGRAGFVADDVEVLVHGVGGALVPVLFVDALLGGQQLDELVEFLAQEAPAPLQVAQQRVGLVLGDHPDAAHARVDAVRQRKIDDAELAAKVHRGLGAHVGQVAQPRAPATCQHQRQGSAGIASVYRLAGIHDVLFSACLI
jgi:hypothetical protein